MWKSFKVVMGCIIISSVSTLAHSQTVSVSVQNAFGQTISVDTYRCSGSSCSPIPPTSVASNTTSSSFGVTNTSAPSIVFRFQANKAGKSYGCQWSIGSGVVGGACSNPNKSPNAYAGVYPSPTCTFEAVQQSSYPSCNVTAVAKMAP